MLEPEPVAGKPTLTMPHLEVRQGDYVEIERVTRPPPATRRRGRQYRGPTWFSARRTKATGAASS